MCVYMYIATYDGVTIVDDKEWNPFGWKSMSVFNQKE